MPFVKHYQDSEIRALLRGAEGAPSPVTNVAAHSRTLHAMTPSGLDRAAQLDRVTRRPAESNAAFRRRGVPTTGAFRNQLQQGAAVCGALNAPQGQAALAVLDDPAFAAHNVRITLTVTNIREAAFLIASGAPTVTTVRRNDAAVQDVPATGVMVILDRAAGANTFHIQTCYPISQAAAVSSWIATEMAGRTVLAQG